MGNDAYTGGFINSEASPESGNGDGAEKIILAATDEGPLLATVRNNAPEPVAEAGILGGTETAALPKEFLKSVEDEYFASKPPADSEPAPEPAEEPVAGPSSESDAEPAPEPTPEEMRVLSEAISEPAPDLDASDANTALENSPGAILSPAVPYPDPAPETFPSFLLGTLANPIGIRNPAHRIFWHGRDINGREFIGSAPSGQQAIQDAIDLGCATCHQAFNPDFTEPQIAPPASVVSLGQNARAQNAFYVAGFEDGQAQADSNYQDLKALVQAYATELAMAGADLDQIPMVNYIRHH